MTSNGVLVAEVAAGLAQGVSALARLQAAATESLYAGAYEAAGARLRDLFEGWGDFLRAVQTAAPAFPEPMGGRIPPVTRDTCAHLDRIRAALARRDWIETADLLSLEGEPLLDAWRRALAAPGGPPAE